jgi:hypothetical protein
LLPSEGTVRKPAYFATSRAAAGLVCARAELLMALCTLQAELLLRYSFSKAAGHFRPCACHSDQRVNSRLTLKHPTTEGRSRAGEETRMLWTIFAILLLLWLLGWGFHIAGSLIHLILVIAVVVLLIELITGRRAAI